MPEYARDYYQVLGVQPGATLEEICHAYRQLAMRYHPDRNPGDAGASERFKRVTEAYEILSDPVARRQYDQRRQRWQWRSAERERSAAGGARGAGGAGAAGAAGTAGATGTAQAAGAAGAAGSSGAAGAADATGAAGGTPSGSANGVPWRGGLRASRLVKWLGYAVGLYVLVNVGALIVGLAVAALPYVIGFGVIWYAFRDSVSRKRR